MATFKCKMCGGSIDIANGTTVAECEYCGTSQTLPKSTDESVQNLYNRANQLRLNNEFDKAEALYEKILEMDGEEAEAYWGVILCRYGIEYVEDPATAKRIPTCHRTSFEPIVTDEYYKKAIEFGDISQRTLYESEAAVIDEIQKNILAISRKEEPFDVFICYKETDENGRRTQDSVVANEIYYELTDAGYKVFYAAITLESKLGSAYEPIIFAALNSARVMLAIGTKPEYFNAVWVKNEWSRFLKMMRNDRKKLLIPCYRDMDAYDLPEEFAHLQAQDMSKIGFITDIVRGIEKVVSKNAPKPSQPTAAGPTVTTTQPSSNTTTSPLLRRAMLFLEEEDWESAEEYAEKVLDVTPECAEAYMVKLLVYYKFRSVDALKGLDGVLLSDINFIRAQRFATPEYRAMLDEISRAAKANTEKKKEECIALMQRGDYASAKGQLLTISSYCDVTSLLEECNRKISEANRARAEQQRILEAQQRAAQEAQQRASQRTGNLRGIMGNNRSNPAERAKSHAESVITEYRSIPSEASIKEKVKSQPAIKNLFIATIVFIFLYWPVAIILGLVRHHKIMNAIKEEQNKYTEIRAEYARLVASGEIIDPSFRRPREVYRGGR